MFKMFKASLLIVLVIVNCNCEPCSRSESVNITEGIKFENGSVVHDGVEYLSGHWYEAEDQAVLFGCPCIQRKCLWKCCGDGQMYFNRSCNGTSAAEVNPFKVPVYEGNKLTAVDSTLQFYYLKGRPECSFRYLVDTEKGDEVMVQMNATLYEIANNRHQWHPWARYCVDMMQTNMSADSRLIAVVCNPEGNEADIDDPALYIAYAVGLLISVPFLLATFLVYAFIPELRNLHGMCLMAYCAGLLVAYPVLAYLKLQVGSVSVNITGCTVLGFLIYYAFQTSFFWLNVMCFDIWRTFRGYRGGTTSKRRERNRFLLYGLYAWGVPAILTAITAVMQFSDSLPDNIIRPGFGDRRCWFEGWLSELIYFFSPVFVLVVCNVVLFTVTAYRIRAVRQETAILKSSESSRSDKLKRDKQRYALYVKLFVVMGVNWIVEVISFGAGGTNWYWIVMDLSNIALGIFIFFIFVWKNKVRGLVRKKFAKWRGQPAEATTLSDSGTGRWATRSSTAATEVTRVNSSDEAGVRLNQLR